MKQSATFSKQKALVPARRASRVFLGGLGLLIVFYIAINVWDNMHRTPGAFCKTFRQEKERLTDLGGSKYHSKVFDTSVDDPSELGQSYKRLAKVAPQEIQTKVEILRNDYIHIEDSANFAAKPKFSDFIAVQPDIERWTDEHCSAPAQ